MRFTKRIKQAALFAAVIVLLAGLISCKKAGTSPTTSSTPKVDRTGWAGNFPAERNSFIGKAPAGALSNMSVTTGSPELSYTFPAFLTGVWAHLYGDSFHLDDPDELGYSIFGWPPSESIGWEGSFVAVYYFDGDAPEDKGLFFASFDGVYEWALVPPGTGNTISAFYYQKVNEDTYFLLNLAAEMSDPEFPSYGYGQPMYPTVEDALDDLLQPGVLDDMLIIWVEYERQ
jgi:hypothetical protein